MPLVAGVDCSTQTTKVLIVDAASGEAVAFGRSGHQVSGRDGARETDPREWFSALQDALSQTGRAGEVEAVAVGGQQHGLVVLGDNDQPLLPAQLWNDTRAAGAARELISEFGGAHRWAHELGVVPVASYTACKWRWLRHHRPDIAASASRVMLPHDYLNFRLTGRAASDRGDASGTAWWSTATESYSEAVLTLIELDPDLLPEVLAPEDAAGEVKADLGLTVGCLVAAGTGDNMAASLGLGLETGAPVISLGTSGTAYAVSTVRSADPTGTVSGFADATGKFLPLAATLNCTLAIDRVAHWFGLDREQIADSTQIVMLPYFDGERTPNLPEASGTVSGLRHSTSSEEILLAAYQGAAFGLIEALDFVDRNSSGIDPNQPLVLIGGGAQGTAWRRVIGELSGRALQIPRATELVALGAAAQAAALIEDGSASEVARRWDTLGGPTIEPLPQNLDRLEQIRRALA